MRPLNVLYLIRTWALGGSHTILFLLLKHLPRDRFHIVPVAYDSHSGGDEKFIDAAARRGFEVAPERIPWKSRLAWGAARRRVDDLIRQYGADLLHTHDPHSNVLVGVGRNRWPCACVASAYGWWERLFPLRVHFHIWAERRFALPRFDRVITVSDNMKQKILRGPTRPEQIRVIRTGLDPETLQPRCTREAVRRQLGIPDSACVVGTISRIYIEKGHTYLLRAVAELTPRHPNIHVLIVGEGPLRPALEEQARRLGIASRVTFTGYYPDAAAALAAMDIFALPSVLDEGFPTAVLEAQAMGLPVIASDTGGTKETLHPNRTGLLTPPRDPRALARAIEEMAVDPQRRIAMGEAARRWVMTSFPLERMIAQVAETYEEAVAAFRKSS